MSVRSLVQEDPLKREMETPSGVLVGKTPWTEEPGGLQSMGSQRVRHHWGTEHARMHARTHTHTHTEQPDHHCIIYALLLLLFSCWVVSYSLQPHELKHFRLLYSPLSLGICSNSCPLSWWCYLTVSSSFSLFSFYFQSFPELGSFPMSWLSILGGQSIRASASASVLPMNTRDWFPLGLTGLISL